jgi:excinuclease ABC subunit B
VTKSIRSAVDETNRRRAKQVQYNAERGITPKTIRKPIGDSFSLPVSRGPTPQASVEDYDGSSTVGVGRRAGYISQLNKLMERAIRKLDYEEAMLIRDRIQKLKHQPND